MSRLGLCCAKPRTGTPIGEVCRKTGISEQTFYRWKKKFAGRVLDQWAYWNDVELDFSRPGKPTDNAYIEAFNARLRAECLNASWFLSIHDARNRIESWRQDDNTARPHSALGNLTPRAFARQAHEARKIA